MIKFFLKWINKKTLKLHIDIHLSLKTFYVICLAIKTINISCKFSGGGGDSGNNEGGVWWWCGSGNKDDNDDNGGDGVSGIKERREWERKGMMKNSFYFLKVENTILISFVVDCRKHFSLTFLFCCVKYKSNRIQNSTHEKFLVISKQNLIKHLVFINLSKLFDHHFTSTRPPLLYILVWKTKATSSYFLQLWDTQ